MTIPNNSASENGLTNQQELLEPKAIRAQVARITASQEFKNSAQLMDFLSYIVEETLAGQSRRIKQYTIAVNAFGRPPHFNPRNDPIVRIEARRLRRGLAYYYENEGRDDPIHIQIPKGKYVPVFTTNSSPSGSTAMDSQPGTTPSSALEPGMPGYNDPSIAVLPFKYLGIDRRDAYIATGITEEIVIALTRFLRFLIVGPLNREALEAQHLGPRKIGREYQVRFILDGTVRVHNQVIRMTSKLIDTHSGQQLWGEMYTYDLETTTIRQIHDELVGQVVATIADAFGIIPRALTKESMARRDDSLSEYEAILRYYHSFYVLTPDAHAQAHESLKRTFERDPDNAIAAGMLGDMILSIYQYGYDDSETLLDQAEALGRRAVALDPNSQPARLTMALVYFLRFQKRQFIREAKECIALNPNHALNSATMALHLYMAGERELGLELMERAMRLNPHHPGWYHLVPYMEAYRRGDYETALIEAHRFNIPSYHFDPMIRIAVLGQLGRQEKANQAINELLVLVPDFRTRGRSLIRRFAFLDEHVEMLVEGLHKAGLEVE